ncbi:MAG: 4'-phosphopantetheinyl transferase superfamily protein [Cohaesibacter sp.]|nr:4'-phosphopantetheinyl transferase superfamily protein [Cohaesibacter sp.]
MCIFENVKIIKADTEPFLSESLEFHPHRDTCKIQTWMIDISHFLGSNAKEMPPNLLHVISDKEIRNARRFKRRADQQKSLLSNYFLRRLLSKFVGLPTSEIKVIRHQNAKPQCQIHGHRAPNFSVSHSGNYIAYAISEKAVGLDIEECKKFEGLPLLVDRFFSPNENFLFKKTKSIHQLHCFYALWTRKEALIKASKQEISYGLSAFEVASKSGNIGEWSYSSIDAPSGYAAALAWPSEIYKKGAKD